MGGVRSRSSRPRGSLAFCLAVGLLCGTAHARPRVAFQPYGNFDLVLAGRLAEKVKQFYAVEIEILPAGPMPQSAFYPPRQRYRAEKLLGHLDSTLDPRFDKLLGLTTSDISTTKESNPDWGIFGLGGLGGRAAVVSGFRLRKGRASSELYETRLYKVILHEIGHTFGLEHCLTRGCLMQDSGGTIRKVDEEAGQLCSLCRSRLAGLLQPLDGP